MIILLLIKVHEFATSTFFITTIGFRIKHRVSQFIFVANAKTRDWRIQFGETYAISSVLLPIALTILAILLVLRDGRNSI